MLPATAAVCSALDSDSADWGTTKLQGLGVHDAAEKSLPDGIDSVPDCRLWLQSRHRGAAGPCAGT